jgi:hypothetical protein
MVLSDQAQRAWKLATAIVTAATGFYVVFHADYGKQEHIFSGVQRWYRQKLDTLVLGTDKDIEKQLTQIKREQMSFKENEGGN